MAQGYYNPPRWQMPQQGGYNPPRSRFWSPPAAPGQPLDPSQEAMWPDQMPPEMAQQRAQAAIAQMQAQAIQQPMPGDMPVGAPIPQQPQNFAPQTARQGDPVSLTGGRAPAQHLSPGGQMPPTMPDAMQSAMAPIGGSAGPGTEIYGETYPSSPTPPIAQAPQPPSAARTALDEMLANRGDKAPWLALAAAGFGTAAGTSPHALTNIGQGGLKGIEMYDRMQDRSARDRLAAATGLLRAEQDDRQARFEQQKIFQGADRIGIEREGLGIRRGEIQQRRDEAAAKLEHDREKLRAEAPERQARAGYYGATAELARANAAAVPDKAASKEQVVIDRIIDNVRQEAKIVAETGGVLDPAVYETTKKKLLLEQAQAFGIDPAKLGVYPPAPKDPSQMRPGGVYDTPRGPLRWTGTGFVPAR